MASGTISIGSDYNIQGRITWESTSNGSTANTSTVKATLQVRRGDSYTTTGTWTGSLNVGGTSESYSTYAAVNGWTTLKTITITKSHSADGSGTCYISGSIKGPSGTTQANAVVSGNDTVTLDTIPRASALSATNANIGSNTTISIASNSSKFTHTLKYSFEGLTGTIVTKTTSTSYKWTVPTSFYAKIPNAKKATCTITCETYSGTSLIGSKTTTFTATAAESACKPTLNPTVKDVGTVSTTLTRDPDNKLIKGYNSMQVNTGAAARNSATLKSYKITCGGKSISTASGMLSYVESDTFTFTATDSRGYTTTQTVKKTMINYSKVTCNLSNVKFNTDGVISFTISGNFWRGSFGAVSNALEVKYKLYEQDGSGSWITTTPTINSNNTYTVSLSIGGLNYRKKYILVAYAADSCYRYVNNDEVITPKKVLSCIPVFDWGENDFNFNVPVNFNAGLTNDNTVLWTGGHYMTESQTISLSKPISSMPSGIVLVFSRFDLDNSTSLNEHFSMHFVPKEMINLHEGKGMIFNMNTSSQSFSSSKYLYISNTTITGHTNNKNAGTGDTGILYDNRRFVMRYVIGV